jgi:hypothetical protein
VTYHGYGRFRSEVLLVAAALSAVGVSASILVRIGGSVVRTLVLASLLTFYLDLQLDFAGYRPLAGVFLGALIVCWLLRARIAEFVFAFALLVLATTLVVPATARIGEPRFEARGIEGHDSDLPPIVHLILDEHIGVEGIPVGIPGGREIKQDLADFYQRQGFRLYGRAFSQYYDTLNSIPNLLNFTSDDRDGSYFSRSAVPQRLKKAAYLRSLSDRGYAIRVYQTDFLDFCSLPAVRIVSCNRYRSTSIGSIENLPISIHQKASFILRSFLDRSTGLEEIRIRYDALRRRAATRGIPLPVWPRDPRVGPISTMEVIEALRRDVRDGARGTVFFAHLLHPHYPYVYDASCGIRPDTSQWSDATSAELTGLASNTAESRARRYALYFEQMRCLMARLEGVFDALKRSDAWEDAVLVVHGDHGSRIVRYAPRGAAADHMTPDDHSDAFSTLFAAKAPGREPGYELTVAPLQLLLADVAGVEPAHAPGSDVFLYVRRFSPMRRVRFAAFRD